MSAMTDARRRGHSVRFTDSEWALVRARAGQAGVTAADFLRRRALEPVQEPPPVVVVPLPLLRRLAMDVRTLAVADQWRFAAHGDEDAWNAIVHAAARETEPYLP